MIPLVIIRPQPGADSTLAAARQHDLDAHVFPMFAIHPLEWDAPPASEFDALLIGSANAMRHGGPGLARYRGMPAYAVGDRTAMAAREAGLDVIATGAGGLQAVLDTIRPEHRRVLRIAGREHIDLIVPAGITLLAREVYVAEPKPMPAELKDILAAPALILLHSGEAASHFAKMCDENAVSRAQVSLAVIGPRVAERAGPGWADVRVAATTSDTALLAIAREMCQDPGGKPIPDKSPMQEDTAQFTPPTAVATPRRTGGRQFTVALLAFMLGAALVGWLVWDGRLDSLLPDKEDASRNAATLVSDRAKPGSNVASNRLTGPGAQPDIGMVEARVAMLEDRLSRIDFQTSTASGNAARAEGLLIAFATRRMIDRGEPLSFVADQLRLRFANAQPKAVETIIAFAQSPVTIDELAARLEALSPELTGTDDDVSVWERVRHEVSKMFTIRRDSTALLAPEARIDRARLMLTSRRIGEAIQQVERLPGAGSADNWIADAHRYDDVQRALDLIETTAMLEPRRLRDSAGQSVEQQSPLATPPMQNPLPAPTGSDAPAATASPAPADSGTVQPPA